MSDGFEDANGNGRVDEGESDPNKKEDDDSDRDGLSDIIEKAIGSDPDKIDSDGDYLTDGDEYNKYKSDPLDKDTDDDGLMDDVEVLVILMNPQ